MITINLKLASNEEVLEILQSKSKAFISFAWGTYPECACEVDPDIFLIKEKAVFDKEEHLNYLAAILATTVASSDCVKGVPV